MAKGDRHSDGKGVCFFLATATNTDSYTCIACPALLLQRGRHSHSSKLPLTTVRMNTRAHQNRVKVLAEQAIDEYRYVSRWTHETTLTCAIIRDLQHLSLLSPKPPKNATAVRTRHSIRLATSRTAGSTAVRDTALIRARAYATIRGSPIRSTPSPTTSSWSVYSTTSLTSNR